MVQFYFLSIFMNLLGGLCLLLSTPRVHGKALSGLRDFLRDPTVSLVIGILSTVTGALKLLTVIRGDIPVVGDFLPAVAGLTVGSTLILEHFLGRGIEARVGEGAGGANTGESGEGSAEALAPKVHPLSHVGRFFLANKVSVGFAGMIAGAVHFLFPMVLFL